MDKRHLTFRERQWLIRDEAIISAAQRLLYARGYSAMSMDELAANVGISKATLYQHVESKETLAVRAIVRSIEMMVRYIEGQDATLPAFERLKDAIQHFLERRYSAVPSVPMTSRTLYPILKPHPEFQKHHTRLMAHLEQLVEKAQAEGSIAPDLPSGLLVRAILSATRDPEYETLVSSGRYTIEELRQTLLTFIFEGMRSLEPDVEQ